MDQVESPKRVYYAPSYTFDIKFEDKKLGVIRLSAVNCDLNSISLEN